MYEDGYTNITNIDISEVVIEKMKAIYCEKLPLMTWTVADATNMPEFADDQFDLVIDKGTFDALVCDSDLHPELKLISEMMRVTKPGKLLIEISNGTPERREKVFKNYSEKVVNTKISLSPMAKLINILRSTSKNKSLKEAIQDPDLMKYALLEMIRTTEEDEEEKQENAKDQPLTAKQKLKRLAKKIYQKKLEDQANQILKSHGNRVYLYFRK